MKCTEKKRYPTKRAATRAQNRTGIGGWLRVYPCPQCGGWHLTSQPKRQRKDGQ